VKAIPGASPYPAKRTWSLNAHLIAGPWAEQRELVPRPTPIALVARARPSRVIHFG